MKFSEIVAQAKVLLQQKGRVSSRVLKREFDLDAEIRRRRTFAALKKLFLRESLKQP